MATATAVASDVSANSQPAVDRRLALHQFSWSAPLLVLVGRSVFIILAQAVAATVFALRRHPSPWNAAAPWWSVYLTLADVGCLLLMAHFARKEGLGLRDLIGKVRLRWGHDVLLGLGCLMFIYLFFWLASSPASRIAFGTPSPNIYPGLLGGRVLPLWAVLYSLFIWLPIWTPTEELTYQGYALPRLIALTKSRWLAILIVGFWFTLQHSFFPLILDWHYIIWKFLAFWPGCTVISLLYLKIRRLPPLIVAHWILDLGAVLITLKW